MNKTGCALGDYDTGRVVNDKKSYIFPNEGQVITLRARDAVPVCFLFSYVIFLEFLNPKFFDISKIHQILYSE